MRRVVLTVAMATSILAPTAFSESARASSPRWCRNVFVGPDPQDTVDSIRAYGPSCSTATRVAAASRKDGAPFDVRMNYFAYGFHCRGQFETPPGGGEGWIQFRCSRGAARITFIHR
jgi:hypothetical protein